MKIRIGFVSNSSSVSFCVYGLTFDQAKDDVERILAEHSELKDIGIYYGEGDYGNVYVGKELSRMKDEETFGEFKKKIREILKKVFKKDYKDGEFGIHEEGYYNG